MDLQFRAARAREWIAIGETEGLTYAALARRMRVHPRTVRRWARRLRDLKERGGDSFDGRCFLVTALCPDPRQPGLVPINVDPLPAPVEVKVKEIPAPDPTESLAPNATRIQLVLAKNRRLFVDGDVDVEVLARVIEAVERC